MPRAFLAILLLALSVSVLGDRLTYEREFTREVIRFASLNRLQLEQLHRDVHVDCYIPLTIATTIRRDGSVRAISIVESSSGPIVDKYFRFVIEQAAPYQPLANHYDPVPAEVTITREFKIDVRQWSGGAPSTRACEPLRAHQ